MRKWNENPTCALEAWVHELRGRTTTAGHPSRINATPVCSGQFLRKGRLMLLPILLKYLQFIFICEQQVPWPELDGSWLQQGEGKDNQMSCTVWIWYFGTSDPQEFKPLVDTSSQCTLMPPRYIGEKSIPVSRVTGDPNSWLHWKIYWTWLGIVSDWRSFLA